MIFSTLSALFLEKLLPTLLSFILSIYLLSAQSPKAEDYGFQHLQMEYEGDQVDILLKSRKGDEEISKPLFLFCQGSLPQPLIKYSEQGMYGVFPFNPDILLGSFHLAIIGKPGVPLIADVKDLGRNFMYLDEEGNVPHAYRERNLLDYYVKRNIKVLRFLQKNRSISDKKAVVAGHSEGSRIAVRMAATFPQITHLIYSGGNPYGRIMSMIRQGRSRETDSMRYAASTFEYWKSVVNDPENMGQTQGDTHKATFQFSQPSIEHFKKLDIPTLVCYGTKDGGAPFNDLLRVQMIQAKKENVHFRAYIGLEHNYFPLNANGQINYEIFNWDNIAADWVEWLER